MKLKRVLVGTFVSLASLVIVDQVALYTVLGDDRLLGRAVAPFDPPLFVPAQVEYLGRVEGHLRTGNPPADHFNFDGELGWTNRPNSGYGEFVYDWSGSRIAGEPLAREKPEGVERVVAIGCSFTHGEESDAKDTWVALVDEQRADLEIANLGVPAFGLDQALLRLRRDGVPLEPDEVWLGFLPSAALRVTTLRRPHLNHWSPGLGFKPRFRLVNGRLELLANPARDMAHAVELLHSQPDYLLAMGDGDDWVNRAPLAYAARGSSLWHRSFFGRVALTMHERIDRDPQGVLAREDGEVFALLRAIINETRREAEDQGARFRLLLLPGRDDIDDLRNGELCWLAFTRALRADGIEVLDLGDALRQAAAPPRSGLFAKEGHYSRKGNEVVSGALLEMLAD